MQMARVNSSVSREPFNLGLGKRAPGIRLALPIVGVSLAELKLPAVVMSETKKGGDPVVSQLKCSVIKAIHRPKVLRQFVIDAKQSGRSKITVARPGVQPDDHLSISFMLHIHERVVVVTGEFRTDHHGRYSTRLHRRLGSARSLIFPIRYPGTERKPLDEAFGTGHDRSFSAIHSLPELTPKHDDRFSVLFQRAVSGDLPVYFAAVPLALCVPLISIIGRTCTR